MTEKLDPKELKVLSDILALVLEDQAGQSAAALEALRTRARRNGMTGGALKNLFTAIAPNPPKRAPASPRPRASRASAGATADVQQERLRVRELTESITRLDMELRTARASNAALKAELFLTQQARAETQSQLSAIKSSAQTRLGVVGLAFLVGCIAGVAGGELFHTLRPPPVHTSNAIYLH